MEKKPYDKKLKDLASTPYMNGVTNSDGEQVIRALTQEEQDFINRFNNEFTNASLTNTPQDIHYELIKASEKAVKKLKKEFKQVSDKLRKVDNGYREMNGEERLDYKEYKKDLYLKKNELKIELDKNGKQMNEGVKSPHFEGYLFIIQKQYESQVFGQSISGDFVYLD